MLTSTKFATSQSTVINDESLAIPGAKSLHIRSTYFNYLEQLPEPLNDRAKQHYIDRLVRSDGRHMLGEYVPHFLGDILDIPSEIIERFTIPWFTLYHHSLLLDDIVDLPNLFGPEHILLSQILLQDFLLSAQPWFSRYPGLVKLFHGYQSESFLATFSELQGDFELYDPINMGRKAALVKFCAAVMNFDAVGFAISEQEETSFDKLCAGIQLLDDLTDCTEDYSGLRFNYPLYKGISLLRDNNGISFSEKKLKTLSSEEITTIIIISGILEELSTNANTYINDGIEELNISLNSLTGGYLRKLVEKNASSVKSLMKIKRFNESYLSDLTFCVRNGFRGLDELIYDGENSGTWIAMRRCFDTVASAAN